MKKLLALVLALVMVLSVTVVASADTIKLEKHPYEKPVRELPYYHYQTVPDSIQTPSFTVTSDWDANATTKKGTVTFAFNTTKDATVADMVANIQLYDSRYDPKKSAAENKPFLVWDKNTVIGEEKYDYTKNFSYNTNTGKLELTFQDLPILNATTGELDTCKELTLVTTGTKWGLNKQGEKEAQGTVNYEMNFKWNPKTDKMEVVDSKTKITSTIYDYSTDAVEATTVEYYANGNPKSVTIKHIDTNHVAGTQVNTEEYQHDYQEGADNDHTDHRYAEATFYYTEEGKLDYYWYNTEVDGSDKQPTTPNDFFVTATGDVMNATVNVKGIEYTYYTKDYYVNVLHQNANTVTPDKLGWFTTINGVVVACAAPEGYENGFANTVHLFATRHWYPKNTVGVVGLSLRDEYPGLTDKWINIVPVDLTVQGTQEIELVAGNMFHIGKAFVDVDGDNVTVTYSYTNNVTEAFSECVKWFKNVDEITTEFCENPTSDLVFGQPVSIANDLGGQEVALLYICNSATYYQTFITKQDAPTRYYENLKKWQNYRAGLYELMDKIPE